MTDIIIIGGGPVGLFLSLQLARLGRSVLLVEKEREKKPGSNAIGIMPPSLAFFEHLGLKNDLLQHGAKIQNVNVYTDHLRFLGCVSFYQLPVSSPYILSVPQNITEEVLTNALAQEPLVERLNETQFVSFKQTSSQVSVSLETPGRSFVRKAAFCVGCDGAQSSVREFLCRSLELTINQPRRYKPTFVMGDFIDRTGWQDEVRLFFTSRGAVESIPLGCGKRRWIVQTPSCSTQPACYLEDAVRTRSSINLDKNDRLWISSFGMQRFLMPRWHFDRVFLAGDSAHIMSPIGGQGMNIGFADAHHLAFLLHRQLKGVTFLPVENAYYTHYRRKAALSAIRRAEWSMLLGTIRGPLSLPRNAFLRFLLTSFLKDFLPPHYTMMTIPQLKEYA